MPARGLLEARGRTVGRAGDPLGRSGRGLRCVLALRAAGREALAQAGLAEVLTHLDETTSNDAAG
ncbi:hypothetical protein BKH22_03845 [Actinomyces oris]|nr:hypothetical protein BKH22_03845 [Actinomyces oris]